MIDAKQEVFAALADPNRRTIIEILIDDGAKTATQLVDNLPITRQGITKHLNILADAGLVDKISAVLQAVGLPTEIPPDLDRNTIAAAMTRDKKKAGGVVKFALPVGIGDVRVGVEVENWREMI